MMMMRSAIVDGEHHYPVTEDLGRSPESCFECGTDWPCDPIRALQTADVIPYESNENLAIAEFPECGWRGKSHRWAADAAAEAEKHRCARATQENSNG